MIVPCPTKKVKKKKKKQTLHNSRKSHEVARLDHRTGLTCISLAGFFQKKVSLLLEKKFVCVSVASAHELRDESNLESFTNFRASL